MLMNVCLCLRENTYNYDASLHHIVLARLLSSRPPAAFPCFGRACCISISNIYCDIIHEVLSHPTRVILAAL